MFNNIPTVVKNLIIINLLFFLGTKAMPALDNVLAGHFIMSSDFRLWQIVTHMFMHADLMHIFFNMYALFLFGQHLEQYWGPKRFLTYYMICGLGAFALHAGVNYWELMNAVKNLSSEEWDLVQSQGLQALHDGKNFIEPRLRDANNILNTPMVGASGAVFGVLLAFGMTFPDTRLMLLFPPIPMKAKYFVIIYGAVELLLALRQTQGDNVAHYAHLGGMIFGFILIKYWKSRGELY